MGESFRVRKRAESFRYALRGIGLLLRSQHNAWIHAAASVAVVAAGWAFEVTTGEWCWLVLAMMAVWTSEALNTSIERLADAAVPERHPLIEQAKDAAAGAVLIAALGSCAIGCLVLGPHLLSYVRGMH